MSQEHSLRLIESHNRFPVEAVNLDVFHAAVAISQRFGLSYLGRGDFCRGAGTRLRDGLLRRSELGTGLRRLSGDKSLRRSEAPRVTADTSKGKGL